MEFREYFLKEGYQILEELGKGATGKVYKALFLSEKKMRAIKVISPELTQREEFQRRFLREMEVFQTLSHPHIVKAFRFAQLREERLYYVIMEYVDGPSLQNLLDEKHQLSFSRALQILKEVALALQCAYQEGLVHRDVKPANILLTKEGQVKLTDFGLVKTREVQEASLTSSGSIVGTPYYLAPEQAFSSKRVDIRADIYSLGITFFHMLAGRPPFVYENALQVITAHCYNPLPPLGKYRKGVPAPIEELLHSMTQKDRKKRLATPLQIVETIEALEKKWGDFGGDQREIKKGPPLLKADPVTAQGTTLYTRTFQRRLLKLGKQLIKLGLLNSSDLAFLMEQENPPESQSLPELLTRHKLASEEDIARALAQEYKLPLVAPDALSISAEVLGLVSKEIAEKTSSLPIQLEDRTLLVAVEDPIFTTAKEEIQFLTGLKVRLAVATRSSILRAIEQNYNMEKCLEDFLKDSEGEEGIQFFQKEGKGKGKDSSEHLEDVDPESGPVVKLVQYLIVRAIEKKASDIHTEPQGGVILIRYRIDGVLFEEMRLPLWILNPFVSRIKILSKLDIAEKRIPQDGRISFYYKTRKIICRVSTLPSHRGEKVVLRLLDPQGSLLSLPELGFGGKSLSALQKAIQKPQGLFLTTGPTGSGKSTTLYSILNTIQSPQINVITLEDPVEYELGGITQVQMNPRAGLTFASALRSVLRQDPDVVLVGEIRDLETAEIAFEASMTGHLVLSTLHTNDTPSTVTRLTEMGMDPFVVASSLEMIVAQRLVRRICENCKIPHIPDPEILRDFEEFGDFATYRGEGCSQCDHKGYKGRVGVYEIMPMSRKLRECIQSRAKEEELRHVASLSGMVTIWEAGLEKLRNGETTIEEILRVVQPPESDEIPCPNCHHKISPEFIACPYCRTPLKILCSHCQKTLQSQWTLCPYCNTHLSPPPGSAPLFLIADDDEIVLEVLGEMLGEIYPHSEITPAENGTSALEVALSVHPDFLILDVNMPGMSGLEVCKKLRSHPSFESTPIFILTANFGDTLKEEAYRAGASDFLAKPINFLEISTKVKKLFPKGKTQ